VGSTQGSEISAKSSTWLQFGENSPISGNSFQKNDLPFVLNVLDDQVTRFSGFFAAPKAIWQASRRRLVAT
jgi:hypothetical protein